jgi:hypothetical protein
MKGATAGSSAAFSALLIIPVAGSTSSSAASQARETSPFQSTPSGNRS